MLKVNVLAFKGFYGTITTSDGKTKEIKIERKATVLEVTEKDGLLYLREKTNGGRLDDAFKADNVKSLNINKVDNYSELELKENAGKECGIKIDALCKDGVIHQEEGSKSVIGRLENYTKLYLGPKVKSDIAFTDTFSHIYQEDGSVTHITELNGSLEMGEKSEPMSTMPKLSDMDREFLPKFLTENRIRDRIKNARNNNGNGHFNHEKDFSGDGKKTLSIIDKVGFVAIVTQGWNSALKITGVHKGTLGMYVNAVTDIARAEGTVTLQEDCALQIKESLSNIQASGKSKTYIGSHLQGGIDLYGHGAELHIAGETTEVNDHDDHYHDFHHAEHKEHKKHPDHHEEVEKGYIRRHHHDPTCKQKGHSCGHVGHEH